MESVVEVQEEFYDLIGNPCNGNIQMFNVKCICKSNPERRLVETNQRLRNV